MLAGPLARSPAVPGAGVLAQLIPRSPRRLGRRRHAAAPVGRVWALLSAPGRWPELVPWVARVDGTLTEGGRLVASGRWLGLRLPIDVEEAEPQQRLVLVAHLGWLLSQRLAVELVSSLRGGTDVTVVSAVEGPLAPVAGVLGRVLAGWLAHALARRASRDERALQRDRRRFGAA